MARIAGVNLPKGKRIEVALTYIYGIGRTLSKDLLTKLKINLDTKVDDLTADQEQKMNDIEKKLRLSEGCLQGRPMFTAFMI